MPTARPASAAVADTTISTIAGSGTGGFSGDGEQATAAALQRPLGVVADASGNVYVADSSNNRVRRIDPGGVITTIAGSGSPGFSGDGGPATAARLSSPSGVAVDAAGNVYVADYANSRIRRIDVAGKISTVAGTSSAGSSGDGGPATAAKLSTPRGVAVDSSGNLYVADTGNNRIRRIGADGTIQTVAGNGAAGFSGDGGPATAAALSKPTSAAVDPAGSLYVADASNDRVRRVDATGVISTFAGGATGLGDGGPATAAGLALSSLTDISGVAANPNGDVLITDTGQHRIRRVDPDGRISTLAGSETTGFSGDGGPANSARLHSPMGVAVDRTGRVVFSDTANNRVRAVTAPPLSIDDVSVDEGNSGTTSATLTVTVQPHSQAFSVDYATSDSTATVTDYDYVPATGTLHFGPGEWRKTLSVQVLGDVDPEPDQAFSVHLTNSPYPDVTGNVTIRNDDGPMPAISIADTSILEGDSGQSIATFTVTKSGTSARSVTVDYATTDGTGAAPADYRPASGTISFAPSETSKTIDVAVAGDELKEPDETFAVKLSNPENAEFAVQLIVIPSSGTSPTQTIHKILDTGTATIIDNDGPRWTPTGFPSTSRSFHTTTLLDGTPCRTAAPPTWCGKVLVAGGSLNNGTDVASASAELYDPMTGTWSPTGSMLLGRWLHTATVLNDGSVLVVGGSDGNPVPIYQSLQESEIYNPATGTWTATSPPATARFDQTATLLKDGSVLVVGGTDSHNFFPPLDRVELFDPSSRTWRHCSVADATAGCPAPLPEPRVLSTAVRLADGRVLVAGGLGSLLVNEQRPTLRSAAIYDPATGKWHDGAPMHYARAVPYSVLLDIQPCGERCNQVLVAGGHTTPSAELYDPATDTWTFASTPDVSIDPTAVIDSDGGNGLTKLGDGHVLLISLRDGGSDTYDPVRNDWVPAHPNAGQYLWFGTAVLHGPPCRGPAPPAYCDSVLATPDSLFHPAPEVRSLNPGAARSAGGDGVVISGAGFSGASVVKFGDLPAVDFRVDSPTQITATAPSQPSGKVEVSVRTPAGGTSRHFPADLSVPFTYAVSQAPGGVADLAARPASDTKVNLSWSAPASDGAFPPPAGRFVVKVSAVPITDDAGFAAAPSLCGGTCEFNAPSIGSPLSLLATGLHPGTTYHFAVRAVNEANLSGPLSNGAEATTTGVGPSAPLPMTTTTAAVPPPTSPPVVAAEPPPPAPVDTTPADTAAPVTTVAPAVPVTAAAPPPPKTPAPILAAPPAPTPVPPVSPAAPATTTTVVRTGESALGQSIAAPATRAEVPAWMWAVLGASLFANLAALGALLSKRLHRVSG